MNVDKLTVAGTNPVKLRQAVFSVISRTQDRPETQVQAMAIALLCTCDVLCIDMRQLLVSMERMRDDLDGPFQAQFRAIREYAQQEIGR